MINSEYIIEESVSKTEDFTEESEIEKNLENSMVKTEEVVEEFVAKPEEFVESELKTEELIEESEFKIKEALQEFEVKTEEVFEEQVDKLSEPMIIEQTIEQAEEKALGEDNCTKKGVVHSILFAALTFSDHPYLLFPILTYTGFSLKTLS